MDLTSIDPEGYLIQLKKFGFLENPFAQTADPRFIYLSPQHKTIFYDITSAIELRKGLAAVVGQYGSGKSSLARLIEGKYRNSPNAQVYYFDSFKYESEFSLLTSVCDALGLHRGRGLSSQWTILLDHVVQLSAQEINLCFLFDDAQKMRSSALDFIHKLYNFDVSRKLVQTIIFGQPELTALINRKPELYDRVFYWLTISSLDLPETINLISHRCTVAGRTKPPFTSTAYKLIYDFSKGSPRRIVIICSEAIERAIKDGKTVINENDIEIIIDQYSPKRTNL